MKLFTFRSEMVHRLKSLEICARLPVCQGLFQAKLHRQSNFTFDKRVSSVKRGKKYALYITTVNTRFELDV
jgi:hypothetical protein